jgi:hypothetical protein
MGPYYTLAIKCKVLPEFSEFIRKKYLQTLILSEDDTFDSSICRYDISYTERLALSIKWKANTKAKKEAIKKEYDGLPKSYRDVIDIWWSLGIGENFYEYIIKDNGIFTCKITKKVTNHDGDLPKAYETFLRDIIVPITSEIYECFIACDLFGDSKTVYTDMQLRGIPFRLCEKIKYVEHTYSEDGSQIIESRVVYKHSIKKTQEIDLNRAYKSLGL